MQIMYCNLTGKNLDATGAMEAIVESVKTNSPLHEDFSDLFEITQVVVNNILRVQIRFA